MTNVIRIRFLDRREYTYFSPEEVMPGDVVDIATNEGVKKGIVTAINVPEDEIARFGIRAKSIIGKSNFLEEANKALRIEVTE